MGFVFVFGVQYGEALKRSPESGVLGSARLGVTELVLFRLSLNSINST